MLAVRTAGYRPLRNQSECFILADGPLRDTSHIINICYSPMYIILNSEVQFLVFCFILCFLKLEQYKLHASYLKAAGLQYQSFCNHSGNFASVNPKN